MRPEEVLGRGFSIGILFCTASYDAALDLTSLKTRERTDAPWKNVFRAVRRLDQRDEK
jgi:hypothetical protein